MLAAPRISTECYNKAQCFGNITYNKNLLFYCLIQVKTTLNPGDRRKLNSGQQRESNNTVHFSSGDRG